jgi:hypothetical protein
MAGENINARMKKTARRSMLWSFESAGPSTGFRDCVRTIVRFIVKPLFENSAEVAVEPTALDY